MKTTNEKLKVSFYLKKTVSRNGLSPVMGRITVGNDMAQFSCKLEADSDLWDTRAGPRWAEATPQSVYSRRLCLLSLSFAGELFFLSSFNIHVLFLQA